MLAPLSQTNADIFYGVDQDSTEAWSYRQAVLEKDSEKLRKIVTVIWPTAQWGEVTNSLSADDRAWIDTVTQQWKTSLPDMEDKEQEWL